MASIVMKDAYLSVGGTDLSAFVRSVTLNYSAEMLDDTAMGDDTHTRLAGLKDWSLEVEFNQDYAASAVDATLFSLVGTSVALIVKPNGSTTGTTNPAYSGNGVLESYSPVGGSIGELATTSVTFQGNGDLSRATS